LLLRRIVWPMTGMTKTHMTPESLAAYHPRLYHVTAPEAGESIKRHGLLSTEALLKLFDITSKRRAEIAGRRRDSEVMLEHPDHGRAVISDNLPLSFSALEKCLDDDLTPVEWLRILNTRVFFWADESGLRRLLGARANRNRDRLVLVVDTLSIVKAHAKKVELSPINTGATLRRPARRGLATFSPLANHSYREWRGLRGGRDSVLEVVVRGSVPDIEKHIVEGIRTG
jgi:hypothetical protein